MENKNKIIKGLFDIKTSLSSEIFELENKLYLLRSSLEDINDEICKVGGHSFAGWKIVIKYIVIREYALFVVKKKLLLI